MKQSSHPGQNRVGPTLLAAASAPRGQQGGASSGGGPQQVLNPKWPSRAGLYILRASFYFLPQPILILLTSSVTRAGQQVRDMCPDCWHWPDPAFTVHFLKSVTWCKTALDQSPVLLLTGW